MNSIPRKPVAASIDDVDSLKPLSAMAIRLSNECQKPDPNLNTAIELIECDPGISSRILALANSPIYGYTRQIGTIPRAAIVLGMRTISNLAISFSAGDVFRDQGEHAAERMGILHHSLGCAVISRILTRDIKGIDPSAAFLSGIMHDIGKLALMNRDSSTYVSQCLKNRDVNPLDTEQNLFGTDHAEIGKRYIAKMRLPPELGMAVFSHHSPNPSNSDLNGIISIANQLSKIWLDGQSDLPFDSGQYSQYEQEAIDSFEAFKCNFAA